jgi:hypothetical protein
MNYFKVRWRYASKLELARSMFVRAKNREHAIQIIKNNHCDPYNELRKNIEILDVSPVKTSDPSSQHPA